jgi:hypothetical protein
MSGFGKPFRFRYHVTSLTNCIQKAFNSLPVRPFSSELSEPNNTSLHANIQQQGSFDGYHPATPNEIAFVKELNTKGRDTINHFFILPSVSSSSHSLGDLPRYSPTGSFTCFLFVCRSQNKD